MTDRSPDDQTPGAEGPARLDDATHVPLLDLSRSVKVRAGSAVHLVDLPSGDEMLTLELLRQGGLPTDVDLMMLVIRAVAHFYPDFSPDRATLQRLDGRWTVRVPVGPAVVEVRPSLSGDADLDLVRAARDTAYQHRTTPPEAPMSAPMAAPMMEAVSTIGEMAASGVVGTLAWSATSRLSRLVRPFRRQAPRVTRSEVLAFAAGEIERVFGADALPNRSRPVYESFEGSAWEVAYDARGNRYRAAGRGLTSSATTVSRMAIDPTV